MHYALFDTAIGHCAIAWGAHGVRGVFLPEGSEAAMRTRVHRRFPEAEEAPPPEPIARAITRIGALLRGQPTALDDIALDMSEVAPFDRQVYEVARAIPPGATRTYGEIAKQLGDPQASRRVGQALGRNPFGIVVPCHRVVAAGGQLGGFSARGGVSTKERLLAIEQARIQLSLLEVTPARKPR